MFNSLLKLRPGLPFSVANRVRSTSAAIGRRLVVDRMAGTVVTFGGWVIILSILAILVVILAEVYPLFKDPEIHFEYKLPPAAQGQVPFALGVGEYREIAYQIHSGGIEFYSLQTRKPLEPMTIQGLGEARITGVAQSAAQWLVLGLSDGRVLPLRVEFVVSYPEGSRMVVPKLEEGIPLQVREAGQPVELLSMVEKSGGGYVLAVLSAPSTLSILDVTLKKNLMGGVRRSETKREVTLPVGGGISTLTLNEPGDKVYVGTTQGQIIAVDLDHLPEGIQTVGASKNAQVGVTYLGFLNGGYTLIMGDSEGGVHSYHVNKDDGDRLVSIFDFPPHSAAVIAMSPSRRDKGFLTLGRDGAIQYHYATTGSSQYTLTRPGVTDYRAVALAPKNDGVVSADAEGNIYHWTVDNPHPSVNLKSLFGKLRYEGYSQEAYVWQSTGGTDDFESKFSLVPLILGTIKGTIYALLFALPIALLGAFYTSQFAHRRVREIVKPTIELMASLPSVILGFFGALVIAPQLERLLPGLVLMPFLVIGLVFLVLLVYEKLTANRMRWVRPGFEIVILIPIALLAGILSFYLGFLVESFFLGGDYRSWLLTVFNVTYDQRNAIVVGLAMGFAVIPIIFTIAEDSLSNVPSHLRAGSLAMGATAWQTAVRVILPVASPGIFSAIMIGFGRAVGETMIVLMATGNTPVTDWSIFNGFRALSANIAVELPEAPEGGSLFRILFLAAFILFVMTFIVNTLAEWVRLRLRERYRVL